MRLILLSAAAFALSGCMFFKADKGLNLFAERDDPQEISDRFHKAAEKQ
jgi:hypothetical protein